MLLLDFNLYIEIQTSIWPLHAIIYQIVNMRVDRVREVTLTPMFPFVEPITRSSRWGRRMRRESNPLQGRAKNIANPSW